MRCPECRKEIALSPDEHLCPECGGKVRQSVDEMERDIARQQAAHSIGRARFWLLIAALVSGAAVGFVYLTSAENWALLSGELKLHIAIGAAVVLIMLALWAMARRWPLPATIAALAIYGGLALLSFAGDPLRALTSPLVTAFQVFVIAALTSGVLAAVKHRRLSRTV